MWLCLVQAIFLRSEFKCCFFSSSVIVYRRRKKRDNNRTRKDGANFFLLLVLIIAGKEIRDKGFQFDIFFRKVCFLCILETLFYCPLLSFCRNICSCSSITVLWTMLCPAGISLFDFHYFFFLDLTQRIALSIVNYLRICYPVPQPRDLSIRILGRMNLFVDERHDIITV